MHLDRLRRHCLRLGAGALIAPLLLGRARAADVERFALGVASGCPRPHGVVLWTRLLGHDLAHRVPVDWEVAHDQGFQRLAARGRDEALARDAHTVHTDVRGLEAGRWYWYRFEALGQRSPVGRTRTAPAPGEAGASLRMGVASCQRWEHGHYAAWRHAAADDLDLVLFLGDYIYEYPSPREALRRHDGPLTRTLDDYRARYALYKSDPALQAAHAAAPWIVIRDDHEVDNDYAGATPQLAEAGFAARRAAAYRAWWEHLPLPRAKRPHGTDTRVYERYDWGRLARIHTLDDRAWRDTQACPRPGRNGSNTVRLADCPALLDPRRTLLGAAQERWLARGWDAERRWNLLAQQTLMARFSWRDPATEPTYWTDGWDGYPAARRRLLQGALDRGANNVVVLGGDVHANYVADLKLDFERERAPVVASEFCGTSISSRSLAQSHIDAARGFNPHVHFADGRHRGYVRLVLDAHALRADLRVLDDPLDAASAIGSAARFVVEAGRPGPQPA